MLTKKSKLHFRDFVIAVLALSSILFFGGAQSHYKRDTLWIALLFLLPLAVQFRGLWILYRKYEDTKARANFSAFYLSTMTVCLMSYCSLWWFYAYWEKRYDWLNRNHALRYDEMLKSWSGAPNWFFFFSVLSLILISIMLLFVVRITRAIIEGKLLKDGEDSARNDWKFWNLDYLKTGATEDPFLALVFFFTVFLGVSYLFGLALAFHDKARPPNNPALYMSNLNPLPSSSPTPVTTLQSSPTPIPSPRPTPTAIEFRFIEGSASVPLPDAAEPNYSTIADKKRTSELRKQWQAGSKNNEPNLRDVIKDIRHETEKHERIRIVVTGYSDIARLSGQIYQSNYELAEARAQNTKQMILERLSEEPNDKEWRNIEWTCLSLSNEFPGSEKMVKVRLETALEDSASMLLKGQHPNSLNLMDYVYFANYTITTTGYGDIVPTTAYSKFICSFANIVEVFFLVVFFNVLLSLKRVERNGEKNPRLTDEEIQQIAEGVRKSGVDETLIKESVKRIVEDNAAQNEMLTEESVRKLIKENDSENRRKIKKIEASMKDKVDKMDIDAKVKESFKSISMAQYLWGKIRS